MEESDIERAKREIEEHRRDTAARLYRLGLQLLHLASVYRGEELDMTGCGLHRMAADCMEEVLKELRNGEGV